MKKVIIADDDISILDSFRIFFERRGYDVAIYPDGNLLLDNEFDVPDIFLLDRQLSGVDGIDICRHLKSTPRTSAIPVVIMSASPRLDRLAISAGADRFIEKPFTMQGLLGIVEELVGGS